MAIVQDKSFASRMADGGIWIVLSVTSLVAILPLLYILSSSFATTSALIPDSFNLDAYRMIFASSILPRSMAITVYITVLGTIISLTLSALMGYALSYKALPGRRGILFLILFTLLFNGGMIPTYMVVRNLGLLNSLWAVMIPSAINTFNMLVMKNFFQNIPDEMRESAKMDGCHELIILIRIILPLSTPALAAFGLFYAVEKWNTYFQALLYIGDSRKWPIQVLLNQILFTTVGATFSDAGSQGDEKIFTSQGIRSAVIIVSTVPIILLYPFLQRHFVKGLLVGSLKG